MAPSIRDLLFSVSQPLNRQVFLHRSTARAHGIAIQEPSPEAHPEPCAFYLFIRAHRT